jgi:hypothetical protein
MALFIKIEKIFEDSDIAKYKFWSSEDDSATGTLMIDKTSGETDITMPMPNDVNEIYGPRAARKVFKHWQKNEFPERTSWAS